MQVSIDSSAWPIKRKKKKSSADTATVNLIFSFVTTLSDLLMTICLSLVAQIVKNLPAMWETQIRSLDWEDPLKEGFMATHSSTLACRIPWTEEPGGL